MISIVVSFLSFMIGFQPLPAEIDPEFKSELEKIYMADVPTITSKKYLQLNSDSVVVLDAREKEEFEVSHLRHARNVGYIWFDMRDIYDIPTDKTIVIYCSVGNRAQRIAQLMMRAGYKKVYNLYGGIFEWVNEGYPVYALRGAQTPQIHAYNKKWSVWLEEGVKVF
jgi:rhodanese-related sulfurtransferase